MDKNFEKSVYKYIKQHPDSTISEIQKGMDYHHLTVLNAVHKLQEEGKITMKSVPLNHGRDSNSSCYYTAVQSPSERDNKGNEYCRCGCSTVTTELDDCGYWYVCTQCGKRKENGYHYFNHYDGEDHDDINDFDY